MVKGASQPTAARQYAAVVRRTSYSHRERNATIGLQPPHDTVRGQVIEGTAVGTRRPPRPAPSGRTQNQPLYREKCSIQKAGWLPRHRDGSASMSGLPSSS